MAVTIYTIAKEANTSISTVSRYLNNKNVRPQTKIRIEKAIEKYHFQPNAIAKGLVTKSTKNIAVLVVDIRLPHYANAAYFIDRELSQKGYRTIICNTSGELEVCKKYVDSALQINVDGIIFVGSIFAKLNEHQDIIDKIDDLPCVTTNGRLNTSRCYSIDVDDQNGIYNATKYLIEKGRRNIKYIQYSDNLSASNKVKGYTRALDEHNLKPVIYQTNDIFNGGYLETLKLIENEEQLDAIITGEDITSMGAIRALLEKNILVGKECDVIGFNSSDYCQLSFPALTAVDNKIEEASKKAAHIMIDILEGKDNLSSLKLQPELKIRESA